jgi:N-acetylmuramoyl-L-alanine amidase
VVGVVGLGALLVLVSSVHAQSSPAQELPIAPLPNAPTPIVESTVPPPQASQIQPAQPSASEQAHSEYIRLRNLDPLTESPLHRPAWVALSERLVTLEAAAAESLQALERARLDGADVALRLWRQERQPALLLRANQLLEPLLVEHRRDEVAAEAAILRGDSAVCGREEARLVESWYLRATSTLGATSKPLSQRARQRLGGVQSGLWSRFIPAPEREAPRLLPRRRPPPQPQLVVLDPGHGGDDYGAQGHSGLVEKEVTLDLARRIRRALQRRGIAAVLTRERDEFLPLARRTAIANRLAPRAFVSLHTNATGQHDARGFAAFFLDTSSDQASRLLAERENGVPPGTVLDDLSFMLSDLIQGGKLEDSMRLTHAVERSVQQLLLPHYPVTRSLGVHKAPFFVLVGAHAPCTLLELFFVDHPVDAALLTKGHFRDQVAEAVAAGISLALGGA